MKFFVAFAALVALAVAGPMVKPAASDVDQIEAIVAAIHSPNTDPATAALLEQQLHEIINSINPAPIEIGPAIIEDPMDNISIGPAIIDFPLPEEALAPTPVEPSPVVVGPIAPGSPSPLVQIIVNVNGGASVASPSPVEHPSPVWEPVYIPEPIQVEEVDPIVVDPVQVVENAPEPVPVEPVIIGTPVIPAPAVNLPEELN